MSPNLRPSRIELRIDELVIEGLPLGAGDAETLRAAVEAELGQLLTRGGDNPALRRSVARVEADGGEIPVAAGDSPETLGRRIGRSIHGGINR